MASPAQIKVICNNGSTRTPTDITGDGIDYVTIDNALNSISNRTSHPITIPSSGNNYSYIKSINFKVGADAPDTQCTNFKFWGTGLDIQSGNVKDYVKITSSYVAPEIPANATGFTTIKTYTSSNKLSLPGLLVSTDDETQFLNLLLEVSSSATQGNMDQQTYYWSYDEN